MKYIVAMTGASGAQYALRLLEKLAAADAQIMLTISEPGCVSLAEETGIKLNAHAPDLSKLFDGAAVLERVEYSNPRDIGAKTAVGMHWGSIMLTPEDPFEAPERFRRAAREQQFGEANAWIMQVGEVRSF